MSEWVNAESHIILMIKENFPELYKRMQTDEYKYSRKIISFKIKNNLDERRMAELCNVTLDTYLIMENGHSSNIELPAYKLALERANKNLKLSLKFKF